MAQTIGFHGAAETVTGSRHLLNLNGKLILIDCGLFQGHRELRELNWQPFPVDPASLDAVIVTHAHTDHIGWLPRLVSEGYKGPIYATPSTIGISRISLPDSGRLQEEEARFRNKKGLTRHAPALPLYTESDAYACLKQFKPARYYEFVDLPAGATYRFLPAGHILGSAFVELYMENGERILFSGDLGRYDQPIIVDPVDVEWAEYVVVESTYGDRMHPAEDPAAILERILNDAMRHGLCVLVPSFAIGRTQELLYVIRQLQDQGRAPRIPVYVDSPMASAATLLYVEHTEDHDKEMKMLLDEHHDPLRPALLQFVRDRNQSQAINSQSGPMVVIAGSGMCNGGRVVHHLLHRLGREDTILLFTGYQAEGTLGRKICDGEPVVEILGQEVQIEARVEKLSSLSAHADQGEIMRWLSHFKSAPRQTFIVHGEPQAQGILSEKIRSELEWDVVIPKQGQVFSLG
jgi:metallo-beta-lactamase family protein